MLSNKNEKCLLNFIACADDNSISKNELLNMIYEFGIELKFKNYNPVYQIIDELNYQDYIIK